MAPIFTIFDHYNYQKLIAQHLADIKQIIRPVEVMFKQGAFVVNITGRTWHAVGLDEAHEMLINKKCKMAIVKPTPEYIQRIAHYLPYRSRTLENMLQQLLLHTASREKEITVFPTSPVISKHEVNVQAQIQCIEENSLFNLHETDRGLINPFSNKVATPEQEYDLLNYRFMGNKAFLEYVLSTVLKQPSTSTTIRKKRMQTFSEKKPTRKKLSQLEKNSKMILTAMKRKLEFSKKTGMPVHTTGEQLLELPLALCDSDGKPVKGQKSSITKTYEFRYKHNPLVFARELAWVPECVLLEGMIIINTTPLGSHKTLKDYATFLINRFIMIHIKRGVTEVHIIFDNPGMLNQTPKLFEQKRRDELAKTSINHVCQNFQHDSKISPGRWRESYLNCRKCKRSLVHFLGQFFLTNLKLYLKMPQTVYIAGITDNPVCWYVQGQGEPQPEPKLWSNAEEADTRIWLHCTNSRANRILVESCDTDVYHIGITQTCAQTKNIAVKISKYEPKYIHLKEFILSIQHDPELVSLNQNLGQFV